MSAGAVADTLHSPVVSVRSRIGAVKQTTLLVAGFTVLAAVLRFARIGHQSFWYDESFTVLLVHHSPSKMLGLLPKTELTPPLYYCLAWVWARLFGYGEAGLRSLSAVAGVATIPAIYGAASKLISRRAGLAAAAIACCNPLLIWYSQEARSYAVLVLLTTLSLLTFVGALSEPTPRRLGAWLLVSCLALATHYFAALAAVPEAIWLASVHRRDRKVLLAVAAAGAFGLALLPIALAQRPQASWIAPWRLDLRLSQIAPQFLLGTGSPWRSWLELAGMAAVLIAVAMLVRRADARERRGALVAGALAASGFLLSLVLLVAGVDELITRNVIVVLIPLIVLIAGGLGARRAGVIGVAGLITLCAVGLIASIGVATDPTLQRPDWRAVARELGNRPTDVARAILLQRSVFLMPLALDMPRLRFLNSHGRLVRELDVIAMKIPSGGWFCWWGSACNLLSSELDTSIHIPGFHRDGPVLHVNQFSILRLRSAAAIRLTPMLVSRALAKAPLRVPRPQPPNLPPGFGAPYGYGLMFQPPG